MTSEQPQKILSSATAMFSERFGRGPAAGAFAPGRVEVLGNHTDYNEGFVLSAALTRGTVFLAAPREGRRCRVVAGNLGEEAGFDGDAAAPEPAPQWINYVKGVYFKLSEHCRRPLGGFDALFLGDLPVGAGLSSSAALEISAALAFCSLFGLDAPPLQVARIGQAAEHEYAGVRCGLLDQISSLFGREGCLVMTDFRSLEVGTVPLGGDAGFLLFNTHVRHALAESAYNERRKSCEDAAAFFRSVLNHPVRALRDVSPEEFEAHRHRMNPVAAKRAAHVIGENRRVLEGRESLLKGRLEDFGRLMFESHESSRRNFENSCPELDYLVEIARAIPEVLGARLSGGGFGGSVVALVRAEHAAAVGRAAAESYRSRAGRPCDVMFVTPGGGARKTI